MSGSGISWAICKQTAPRTRQRTMPAPTTQFLQAGCPSCRPTNSVILLTFCYWLTSSPIYFFQYTVIHWWHTTKRHVQKVQETMNNIYVTVRNTALTSRRSLGKNLRTELQTNELRASERAVPAAAVAPQSGGWAHIRCSVRCPQPPVSPVTLLTLTQRLGRPGQLSLLPPQGWLVGCPQPPASPVTIDIE